MRRAWSSFDLRRRVARLALLAAAAAVMLSGGFILLVWFWVKEANRTADSAIIVSPDVIAPWSYSWIVLVAAMGLYATMVGGRVRWLLVGGVVAGVVSGIWLQIFLELRSASAISRIVERDGGTVVLAIDPAWDVRQYSLYDVLWGGLALRLRPNDGAIFWEYPHADHMRLGLDRNGRAILLNPRGERGPFPDGLNTFPCPAGSPPGCAITRSFP